MAGAPSGSWDRPLLTISLTVSGNNLSASTDQFIFVKPGNVQNTVVPAASGDIPLGLSYSTGRNGEAIDVVIAGVGKLRLAGSVKQGNMVKVYTGAADGRGVLSTNTGAYGGMALQDGVSGQIIPVLLCQGNGS